MYLVNVITVDSFQITTTKCKTGCPLSTVELFEFYMATAVILTLCYFLKTWEKIFQSLL